MILLDSSLIIAYSNKVDQNHNKALKIVEDIVKEKYGTPAITDYIFDETITVMTIKTKDLTRIAESGDRLLEANVLLRIDEQTFQQAWKIFKDQQKPHLSFTDCTTIAACKTNGIPNLATFDEDFRRILGLRIIGL